MGGGHHSYQALCMAWEESLITAANPRRRSSVSRVCPFSQPLMDTPVLFVQAPVIVTWETRSTCSITHCQGKLFTSDSSVGEIQEKETRLEGLYLHWSSC
jgi:hypothetical protein